MNLGFFEKKKLWKIILGVLFYLTWNILTMLIYFIVSQLALNRPSHQLSSYSWQSDWTIYLDNNDYYDEEYDGGDDVNYHYNDYGNDDINDLFSQPWQSAVAKYLNKDDNDDDDNLFVEPQ